MLQLKSQKDYRWATFVSHREQETTKIIQSLRDIIADLGEYETSGNLDVNISGISSDSRQIKKGFLFAAISGFNLDGHAFISQALKAGAAALLVEKDIGCRKSVATVKVTNSRRALGLIASRFYGYPSRKLKMIGVGGTNGKTTTTYLIKGLLSKADIKTAVLGTIAYQDGNAIKPSSMTTPDSLQLQSILAKLFKANFAAAVMEVTSHALVLDRVIGCNFNVGVFTNFSRDHLDFHETMENYLEAETELFRLLNNDQWAVINRDDAVSSHIIKNTRARALTYSIGQKADIVAHDIKFSIKKSTFKLETPLGKTSIELKLPGRFNVLNALAAVGVGITQGISLRTISEGISSVESVPGRFELVNCGQPFNVVVDYAHTDDALKNILQTVRSLCKGRIITVFGCGGERDKGKRPIMGEAVANLSDLIILTSDNPRSEDPEEIIKDIEAGIKMTVFNNYFKISDRFDAISKALSFAQKDDLVLIAGKGHENYQVLKDKVIPFVDKEVVEKILRRTLNYVKQK